MSTAGTLEILSTSFENTVQLAAQIGQQLRGGEVIELVGDLGSGKTAFVRGLAEGLGSQDTVHSPSFTLSNEYHAGSRTLYHLDLHRLDQPGIISRELAEFLADPQAIVVVEWANIVEDVLSPERLTIKITTVDEAERKLHFAYPVALEYLVPKAAK